MEREREENTDRALLRAWVEKRSRELLRVYDRDGEIYTQVPDDGDVIRIHACLPKEHRRVDGPAIPHALIEQDGGRQALIALTSFIFLLPKRVVEMSTDPVRSQVWLQSTADELLAKHGREGHLITTAPEGRGVVRVRAYLAGDGRMLSGPEIPSEWIEENGGHGAAAALEAFILSLPASEQPGG